MQLTKRINKIMTTKNAYPYKLPEEIKPLTTDEIDSLFELNDDIMKHIELFKRLAESSNLDPVTMVNIIKYKFIVELKGQLDQQFSDLNATDNITFQYFPEFSEGYLCIIHEDGSYNYVILPEYLTDNLIRTSQPGAKLDYVTVRDLYEQHNTDIIMASYYKYCHDELVCLSSDFVGYMRQGFSDQQISYILKEAELMEDKQIIAYTYSFQGYLDYSDDFIAYMQLNFSEQQISYMQNAKNLIQDRLRTRWNNESSLDFALTSLLDDLSGQSTLAIDEDLLLNEGLKKPKMRP